MFIITSKKYEFECPYTNSEFKKKFDREIKDYTYRQLRKDFHLSDLYYGKRNDNTIEIHFHRFGKRDLDNPMFVGSIGKGENKNSTKVEGKFKRKTSNLIISLLIIIFWLFVTIIGFTQNLTAGIILTAITCLAVYIFFWDNNTPQQIIEYFSGYDTPLERQEENTDALNKNTK